MYDIIELNDKSLEELYTIAATLNISKVKSYSKEDLVYKILDEQAIQGVGRPARKPRARIATSKKVEQKVMEVAPAAAPVVEVASNRAEGGVHSADAALPGHPEYPSWPHIAGICVGKCAEISGGELPHRPHYHAGGRSEGPAVMTQFS